MQKWFSSLGCLVDGVVTLSRGSMLVKYTSDVVNISLSSCLHQPYQDQILSQHQAVWMVEWVSLAWLAGSQGRVIASALESLESLRHQQFE